MSLSGPLYSHIWMVQLYQSSYIKSNNDSLQPVASIVVSLPHIMGVTQPSWVWHNKQPLYSKFSNIVHSSRVWAYNFYETLPFFYEHFRRRSPGLKSARRHKLRPW